MTDGDVMALLNEKDRLVRENRQLREAGDRHQADARHWNVAWQEEKDGREQDVRAAIEETVERCASGVDRMAAAAERAGNGKQAAWLRHAAKEIRRKT